MLVAGCWLLVAGCQTVAHVARAAGSMTVEADSVRDRPHLPRQRHGDPGLVPGEAVRRPGLERTGLLRYALHEPISQVVDLLGSPVGAPLRRDRCFGRAAWRSRREVAPTGGFVVHGTCAVSGRNRWLAMTPDLVSPGLYGGFFSTTPEASRQVWTYNCTEALRLSRAPCPVRRAPSTPHPFSRANCMRSRIPVVVGANVSRSTWRMPQCPCASISNPSC